ncbi:hypothetical protein [Streptomyces otsuchiensis]|uniref:hypothetical protein n=1 Tax=Streptomyces otsuchiensis TaxID=2681388 RepID=UPI0010303805|nr:hypothetical protein [Streptomyces otsuchiensis]
MSTGAAQPPGTGGNPYQQPGYHAPNPYQDATVGAPAVSGPGQGGGQRGGPHRTRMALAIAASVVMVAATAVGGYLLVGSDDDSPSASAPAGDDAGAGGEEPEGSEAEDGSGPDAADGEPGEESSDPRGGLDSAPEPVTDDDWQVQAFPERDIAYDVPGRHWTLLDPELYLSWTAEVENEDGEKEETFPLRAASLHLDEVCGPGSSRSTIGVTGARGAAGTEEAAPRNAESYAYAAYDDGSLSADVEVSDPEPFTNDQGFEGHISTATIENYVLPEDGADCYAPSGKVIAVSYLDSSSDVQVWLAVVDTGVDDELEQETIDSITNSLRLHEQE